MWAQEKRGRWAASAAGGDADRAFLTRAARTGAALMAAASALFLWSMLM